MSQLERDDDRLLESLDFAGLGPFVRSHPRGLDLEIRGMGEGLSVGQRQGHRLGADLAAKPARGDSGRTDCRAGSDAGDHTGQPSRPWLDGRTAIIATHRVPILQLTNRVVIMQNGRLVVGGPREAVLAHLNNGGVAAQACCPAWRLARINPVKPFTMQVGGAKP